MQQSAALLAAERAQAPESAALWPAERAQVLESAAPWPVEAPRGWSCQVEEVARQSAQAAAAKRPHRSVAVLAAASTPFRAADPVRYSAATVEAGQPELDAALSPARVTAAPRCRPRPASAGPVAVVLVRHRTAAAGCLHSAAGCSSVAEGSGEERLHRRLLAHWWAAAATVGLPPGARSCCC